MSDPVRRDLERRGLAGDLDARRAYRAVQVRLGIAPQGSVEILDRRRQHVGEGRCRVIVEWRVNTDWPWPLGGRAVLVHPRGEVDLGPCWTGARCVGDLVVPCCGTDQLRVEFRRDPD